MKERLSEGDVRDRLLQQDTAGSGQIWKSRVENARRLFGFEVEDLAYSAIRHINPDWDEPRRRKEAAQVVEAYNRKVPGKEPCVWMSLRAMATLLYRVENPYDIVLRA